MSEEQKKQLEAQLWAIADLLRGKISPDDYRDYILGFIFYKYLSEKQYLYANELLQGEEVTDFKEVTDTEILAAIKEESLLKLGYFLLPNLDSPQPHLKPQSMADLDCLQQLAVGICF